MAITQKGILTHSGNVLYMYDHYYADGMVSEYAVIWNTDEHKTEHIQVGYYGSDFYNFIDAKAEVDVCDEVRRDILRTLKRRAMVQFAKDVTAYKNRIAKGTRAEVVKGRKVPKGTILNVFWVGERETYKSRQYNFMHETETIAGAYDEHGQKVWIKADYLKSLDPIKSPNAKERNKYIKAYVERERKNLYI